MQRIHDIKKWNHVAAGGAMNFENEAVRRVRLDVNAAGRAALFYIDGDGETTLLGVVEGRDVIEFATHGGSFSIAVEDSDVWVYTIDGENLAFSRPDAVKFTKLVERRARNPDVEYMQWLMRHNQRVMLEQQEKQFERMRAELERISPAASVQPAPEGDVAGTPSEPKPDERADAGKSDSAADGGNQSGAKKAK